MTHRKKIKIAKGRKPKGKTRQNKAPTHNAPKALNELKGQTPLFPAHTTKKLPYYELGFSLTGTAGVITQYAFSANGLYDPNVTGTGHQPLGFDTMMLYYEQYTVLRSRITIRMVGNGSQAAVVSLCLAPDTTALALPDVMENGLCTTHVVDGRGNGGYGTGTRIGRLDLACDVAKYFGRRTAKELLDDPNLYGTVSSNPTEQVYFIVNMWGFGTFSDNTNVICEATIEYIATFWEPRKVAAQLHEHKESAVVVMRAPCKVVKQK